MRTLSSLIVALLALTNVGTALHYALVRHGVTEGGALVHMSGQANETPDAPDAPNTIASDARLSILPTTGCAVSALQHQAFDMPPPAQAVSTLGTATSPLPIFCLRVCDSGDIYRLAPKNGPPA